MSLARSLKRLSICAVFAGSTVAVAPSALAEHAWASYHWARTSNPFTLKLGDNVTSAWDIYLETTSQDWSVSTVLDTTIVAGGTRPRSCRGTTGRVEVCNSKYGSTGWLGVASISVSGNHITSATVKVNDTYFTTPQYNTPAWRNLVMCQEVGHAFGLAHQDEVFDNQNLGSCMDYTNDPASNQHPNAHDYEQLQVIYSHLDSSSTVQSAPPPAMSLLELEGPGQWGRVVASYADGRPKFYELDFGGGHKIITHVFWVPESNRADR